MADRPPSIDEALGALSRLHEWIGDDPKALQQLRTLTGLSITDPEADEQVMRRRLEASDRETDLLHN